ncbi:MAG TPA: DUF4255 domain-containing protein [Allosphingosinicella sp.]|nr:DUF4255 domain-containing protein [Allosphingosinicella sp.]
MATSDLSSVSTSLHRLLSANIDRLAGQGAPAVAVTLGSPEDQSSAVRTVNLHLYHVAEDPFNRNLPPPGSSANGLSATPMSLSLFYLMTAHHNGSKKAEIEQQIMGYALKTLRDFSLVSADTQVADENGNLTTILAPGLAEGSSALEIILRPLTPEDAIAYWASEQQQSIRLSAYYEVRIVRLEPEPPGRFAEPVLSFGQWVGPMADVALSGSRSVLAFAAPPALAGSLPDRIEVSPARAFLDVPPANDAAFPGTNIFRLVGSGLRGGVRRRIVLRHPGWPAKGVPGGEIAIGEAVQPAGPTSTWGVRFDDREIEIRVADRIDYVDAGGAAAQIDVVPGFYGARVEIVVAHRTVGNRTREIVRRSNEVPFMIAPRLHKADSPAGPQGQIKLHASATFDLQTAGIDVALIVDGVAYALTDPFSANPADNDGCFRIDSASTIIFQPSFDPTVAGHHGVRLSVNGVESQPFWAQTP